MNRFDLIVLGAGPAGCSAAISVVRRGGRVALIGASAPRRSGVIETLDSNAAQYLRVLGLEGSFSQQAFPRCWSSRSAWGETAVRERSAIFDAYGPGWLLERDRFDRWMREEAIRAGTTCFNGSAREWRRIQDGWRIELDNGAALEGKVTADASGRKASFARSQGAVREVWDRLVGVSGCKSGSASCELSTLIEAAPAGWWYSAPSATGDLTISFMSDPDLIRRFEADTPRGWRALLAQTIFTAARAGADSKPLPDNLQIWPAGSSRLSRSSGPDWLAIGDACESFDPLSSQGVLSALASGVEVSKLVAALSALQLEVDPAYESEKMLSWLRYIAGRNVHYGLEQRWSEQPFWTRRSRRSSLKKSIPLNRERVREREVYA